MTIESEFVFDCEPSGETSGAVPRVRQALVGIVLLLGIIGAVALLLVSSSTVSEGAQSTAAESIPGEAASDGWTPFLPVGGELPAWLPPPMVRRVERICIGFARADFGPDEVRPSLARCERERAEPLAANEIRSLTAIQAGFDTWHFIEAADDITSITVHLTDGEVVSDDRILLSGPVGAVRLQNERDVSSIKWSTRSATYRCASDPQAWTTSTFCSSDG